MPTSYSSQSHPGNLFFQKLSHHYRLTSLFAKTSPQIPSSQFLHFCPLQKWDHSGGQYLFSSPESLCHTPKKKKIPQQSGRKPSSLNSLFISNLLYLSFISSLCYFLLPHIRGFFKLNKIVFLNATTPGLDKPEKNVFNIHRVCLHIH